MDIKQAIIEKFGHTEDMFSTHESDLYVKDVPGLRDWIKSNNPSIRPEPFRSAIDGSAWLDLPFQNSKFWSKIL